MMRGMTRATQFTETLRVIFVTTKAEPLAGNFGQDLGNQRTTFTSFLDFREGVNVTVGIDLAGVETRPTGFCILEGMNACTCLVYSDKEILDKAIEASPRVVAIDAPLALPKGRTSLEERNGVHLRQCDKELRKMGIKFFPVTLGPMRKLTERGIRLKKNLVERRLEVIETYPRAAQDLLRIPRKQHSLSDLKKALEKLGVKGLDDSMTGDELDAVTCALVGKMYLEGDYIAIGDPEEILMILPKP